MGGHEKVDGTRALATVNGTRAPAIDQVTAHSGLYTKSHGRAASSEYAET